MAAPVGGQILSEILPYLNVEQENLEEKEEKVEVTTPNLIGKSINEAEKILKDIGLKMKINNEYKEIDKNTSIVSNQLPQAGIQTYSGSYIYIDF